MAIGTAYFDASGKKETSVLAVAGFLSPTLTWLEFEKKWSERLNEYGVSELHMNLYAHSTGEYEPWKGNEPLRSRFLGDLLSIIKDHADNSFATAVHMQDYRAVDQQFCLHEWAHPYAIAGADCLGKIQIWANKHGYDYSSLDYVFEDGDEGKGSLFNLASKYVGINPIFKKKSASVVFQAADLIAYEHFRANQKVHDQGEDTVYVEDLRIPFQSLVSIPGSAEWGIILEENLLDTCKRYGIPAR